MDFYDNVSFEEWDQIADCCDYATFYHTPSWLRIFAKTYPNMAIATKKIVMDGEAIVILPLLKSKGKMG